MNRARKTRLIESNKRGMLFEIALSIHEQWREQERSFIRLALS